MHVSIILCLGIVRRFQPPLTSYILQNVSFIILHTLSPHKRISHSNGVKLMKTQILLSYIHYTFMEDIDFISAHPPRADFLRKRKYDREFKILTAETSRRDRGQKPIKSFASKTLRFDARWKNMKRRAKMHSLNGVFEANGPRFGEITRSCVIRWHGRVLLRRRIRGRPLLAARSQDDWP